MSSSTELHNAIDHTLPSRFQALIKKICDTSPSARALVEAELLAPSQTSIIDLTNVDSQSALPTQPSTGGVKRQRFAMCKHCKEEFDVTENDGDSCEHHPGTLEIDWSGDAWADLDEDCHGPIDLDLADEYPEGFRWDCCDGVGDAEGCAAGPHEQDAGFKPEVKRRRVWE